MTANRDTRVQIVIVENGKYILLEHLAIKENKTFWGLPGGGREPGETDEEAALREAEEETGLAVKLLPVKHEVALSGPKFIYNRIVTFVAYPVSGEATVGYEPEASLFAAYNYRLIGLKWQKFHDDAGLEVFTKKSIQPVRQLLVSAPITRKAAFLGYRRKNGSVNFLLEASKEDPGRLALPQTEVVGEKLSEETIKTQAAEMMGIPAGNLKSLAFFFGESHGSFYRTDVFSLPMDPNTAFSETNGMHWVDGREAVKEMFFRQDRQLIKEFMDAPTAS